MYYEINNYSNLIIFSMHIADFSLSKRNYPKDVFGLLPYVDPKCLNNINNIKDGDQPYEINDKSDIYSIGVLFWQLSSGLRPFCTENDNDPQYDAGLAIAIENGKREDVVKGTPVEYSNLYTPYGIEVTDRVPTTSSFIIKPKMVYTLPSLKAQIIAISASRI